MPRCPNGTRRDTFGRGDQAAARLGLSGGGAGDFGSLQGQLHCDIQMDQNLHPRGPASFGTFRENTVNHYFS